MTIFHSLRVKILGVMVLSSALFACGGASSGGDIAKQTPPTQRTPEPTATAAPTAVPEPTATPDPSTPAPTAAPNPVPTPQPPAGSGLGIVDGDSSANRVMESVDIGVSVGISATVSGDDAPPFAEFALAENAFFSVDPVSGVVTTKAALDYETTARHQLELIARFTDGSEVRQAFEVDVLDNRPPVIERPISFIFDINGQASLDLLGTATDPEGNSFELQLRIDDSRTDIEHDSADGDWFIEDIILRSLNSRASVVAIDLSTGETSTFSFVITDEEVSPIPPTVLMLDEVAQQSLIFNTFSGSLSSVDLTSATTTLLSYQAKPGAKIIDPVDAAIDTSNRRVLVLDRRYDGLVAIDLATGSRQLIGASEAQALSTSYRALTLDETNNRALVFSSDPLQVVAFDLLSGAKTILFAIEGPNHPFDQTVAIDFDPRSNTLYVMDAFPNHTHLHAIDLVAGEILRPPASFEIELALDDPATFSLSKDGTRLYFPGESSFAWLSLGEIPATDVEVVDLSIPGSQALNIAVDEDADRIILRGDNRLFVAAMSDGDVELTAPLGDKNPQIISGKTYKIINKETGRALEVPGGSLEDGESVGTFPFRDRAWHKWVVSWVGDSYSIIAQHSEKALNISGNRREEGNAIQWPYDGEANARWRIEAREGGYFEVISVFSGEVLDEEVSSNNVTEFPRNDQDNQRWYFEALN